MVEENEIPIICTQKRITPQRLTHAMNLIYANPYEMLSLLGINYDLLDRRADFRAKYAPLITETAFANLGKQDLNFLTRVKTDLMEAINNLPHYINEFNYRIAQENSLEEIEDRNVIKYFEELLPEIIVRPFHTKNSRELTEKIFRTGNHIILPEHENPIISKIGEYANENKNVVALGVPYHMLRELQKNATKQDEHVALYPFENQLLVDGYGNAFQ